MPNEIAVCLGKNGETASLYDQGKLVVYRKIMGKWKVLRERAFVLDQSQGLQDLRKKMRGVLDFLNDCKIFVGLSVVGVPYFELEKARCSIWEFEGEPAEFLDYILEKEEEVQLQKMQQEKKPVQLTPVETSGGCYWISLKEIQEKNTGYTSKQVLLPFLRQANFYSLEVICNHIPPWLEAELISGNLSGEVEKIRENEIKVVITKKSCYQCK